MPALTPDRDLYDKVEQTRRSAPPCHLPHCSSERVRIGISANYNESLGSCISRAYSDAVTRAGGIPYLLPLTDDPILIGAYLDDVDGLLLSGGDDIFPYYVGEDAAVGLGDVSPERDRYDLLLIKLAAKRNIPVLGICRGHQLIAAAFGGTLYQDIYTQSCTPTLNHNPRLPRSQFAHCIAIQEPNSVLARLMQGKDTLWVNSLHHQAVKTIPPGFIATAVSADGINEAMEAYPEKAILSVQWHPEQMIAGEADRDSQQALFDHLVSEATLYKQARAVHRNAVVVDSHVDTPMHFGGTFSFETDTDCLVDLPKMQAGLVDAVLMAAYLPQGELSEDGFAEAEQQANRLLEGIHRIVERAKDSLCIASSPGEIRLAKRYGRKAIVPAIENGYAIGGNLSQLYKYKELGVTYITLCHNGDNQLCDSAVRSSATHGGLSQFGRYVVAEMNRLGIAIDVSHASDQTILDLLECSKAPVFASHSSARALADHPRNLSDELIRKIADRGGVIQVCLYSGFLREDANNANLYDAVDHIEHIIGLVGAEAVGIGSDFDGGTDLIGCRNASDLIRLSVELLRRGHSENELRGILGGNLMRYLSLVQDLGRKWMPVDV